MKRVFKTRHFDRVMKSIEDRTLCAAVEEMIHGLTDADLGGHILKKRVALSGKGKRGGARTLVATRKADRWFFVFGFAKNEKANISSKELAALQKYGADLWNLTEAQLDRAIVEGALVEICHDQDCQA